MTLTEFLRLQEDGCPNCPGHVGVTTPLYESVSLRVTVSTPHDTHVSPRVDVSIPDPRRPPPWLAALFDRAYK